MPVEMGDAATSIVGRLITLSGCLPQATGVIRPPFIPAGSPLDLCPLPPGPPSSPPQNPKTDGPTSKRLQCDRIIRYFHVRWLNWNATGDLRRGDSNPNVGSGLLSGSSQATRGSINLIYPSDKCAPEAQVATALRPRDVNQR